jgi:hypothetical protein
MGNEVYCSLLVKDGVITEINVEGSVELERACRNLTGCRHMAEDVQQVLEKENIFNPEFDIYNFF